MPNIEYRVNDKISVEQFIDLLERSTLAAPAAMEYYPKVGFEKLENAFAIKREK